MLLCAITFFFLTLTTCGAVDTIAVNQSIKDGETIVSESETFELGFFSPGSSKNRYLGIWYKKIWPRRVIWVANRENPLDSTSGVFKFNSKRVMLLLNGTSSSITWSCNFSIPVTDITTTVAQLLDTGNFVIKDESDSSSSEENIIWQSFDYPGNAFLPGMKFGKNYITGREKYLTSWRSEDDPSPGEYTFRWVIVKDKYPQVYKMKGSVIETRLGPWTGDKYAGLPSYTQNPFSTYKMEIVVNEEEAYYWYTLNSTTVLEMATLTQDGRVDFWHHVNLGKGWIQDWSIPLDNCDSYGLCGPHGSCNTVTSPYCRCLKGFEPAEEWRPDNWAIGCRRRIALNCGPGEDFVKFSGIKLPDTQDAWFKERMTLGECDVACKRNCSCTAYANPYTTADRGGCLLWFGDLIDVRVYPQRGQDLYVRMAASELLYLQSVSNRKKQEIIKFALSISAIVVVLCVILALYAWSKRKRRLNVDRQGSLAKLLGKYHSGDSDMGDIELPLFSLSQIVWATNNFSVDNKIGEGGFGPVYKGVLDDVQEIAVKRLSKSSRQGLQEFKNEIICIAKLQHRNLVKLLGYCIQGDETMLIYEYMPNKSLDQFIFDDSKKSLLDWPKRFRIIHGIARGLLYLHQDSRLRIVHRDLKAGNILLDSDLNPKISDFGLARMFRGHETEANTKKVVGTFGYISPEYVVNGLFSVKSDIFSFGVMVLEIVCGKQNRGFSHEDHSDNLLGHAWRLYSEGKSLDLVDECLGKPWSVSEVMRSINIGLLCVQRRAEERPSMSSVLFMLGGEVSLPPPKRPGFFTEGSGPTLISPSPLSFNEVTITQIDAR